MKQKILSNILFLCIILFYSCKFRSCEAVKINDQFLEASIQQIVDSIKSKDYEKFSERLKREEDFIYAMENLDLPGMTTDGKNRVKQLMSRQIEKNIKKSDTEGENAYNLILQSCRKYKIDLPSLSYVIIQADIVKKSGIFICKPRVRINSSDRKFLLILDLTKSNRGWIINFAEQIAIEPD